MTLKQQMPILLLCKVRKMLINKEQGAPSEVQGVPKNVNKFGNNRLKIGGVIQVILAATLTEVQGDIRCKVLAALSTVK